MSVVDAAFARRAAAPTGKPIFGEDKVQAALKKQAGALIEVYYQSAEISKLAKHKRDKYVKAYANTKSRANRDERDRTQRVFENACERTERLLQVLNDLLAELGIQPMVDHDQCAVDEHNRMVEANAQKAQKEAEALRRRAARAAPARGGQYDVPMGYVV
jgi:hypothetical protein